MGQARLCCASQTIDEKAMTTDPSKLIDLIDTLTKKNPGIIKIDIITDGFDIDHLVMHEFLLPRAPLVTWQFKPSENFRIFDFGPTWPWWKPKTKFFERCEMREQPVCVIDVYKALR